MKSFDEKIEERFIKTILDSVTKYGRATTSLIGARRAYDAVKREGLILDEKLIGALERRSREAERERIIALLEARHKDLSACHSDDECQSLKWGVDLAISDIEGDNK